MTGGGAWLDELTALTGSAPYEETLAYQRALDRAYAKEHPVVNVAGSRLYDGGAEHAPLFEFPRLRPAFARS